jgi:hypothetical protein
VCIRSRSTRLWLSAIAVHSFQTERAVAISTVGSYRESLGIVLSRIHFASKVLFI